LRKAALAGDQPVVSDLSSPPEAACPGGPGQRPSGLALDWIELAVDRPGAGLVIYREAGPNGRCGDGDDRYRYVRLDRSGAARDLPVPTLAWGSLRDEGDRAVKLVAVDEAAHQVLLFDPDLGQGAPALAAVAWSHGGSVDETAYLPALGQAVAHLVLDGRDYLLRADGQGTAVGGVGAGPFRAGRRLDAGLLQGRYLRLEELVGQGKWRLVAADLASGGASLLAEGPLAAPAQGGVDGELAGLVGQGAGEAVLLRAGQSWWLVPAGGGAAAPLPVEAPGEVVLAALPAVGGELLELVRTPGGGLAGRHYGADLRTLLRDSLVPGPGSLAAGPEGLPGMVLGLASAVELPMGLEDLAVRELALQVPCPAGQCLALYDVAARAPSPTLLALDGDVQAVAGTLFGRRGLVRLAADDGAGGLQQDMGALDFENGYFQRLSRTPGRDEEAVPQ
ncbi:MAG: hypothetical protein D6809_00625, partial [Gammaproteobacteria bacterium]